MVDHNLNEMEKQSAVFVSLSLNITFKIYKRKYFASNRSKFCNYLD